MVRPQVSEECVARCVLGRPRGRCRRLVKPRPLSPRPPAGCKTTRVLVLRRTLPFARLRLPITACPPPAIESSSPDRHPSDAEHSTLPSSMCPFSKLGARPPAEPPDLTTLKSIVACRRRPCPLCLAHGRQGLAAQAQVRLQCLRALPPPQDPLRRRDALRHVQALCRAVRENAETKRGRGIVSSLCPPPHALPSRSHVTCHAPAPAPADPRKKGTSRGPRRPHPPARGPARAPCECPHARHGVD